MVFLKNTKVYSNEQYAFYRSKIENTCHKIRVKEVVSVRHGEYMDWWTEAQYVFTIGKTSKVTDSKRGGVFISYVPLGRIMLSVRP